MRVKSGIIRHSKHKKIIKAAKGYQGRRKSVFKLAKQAVVKAGQYAYRDRRVKKRAFRALWIVRLNAALRAHSISYSVFINKLSKANIAINRKILAGLAVDKPEIFTEIVNKVK